MFITAPVSTRNSLVVKAAMNFAWDIAEQQPCEVKKYLSLERTSAIPAIKLEMLESSHRAIMLYMWLGFRYPSIFTQMNEAREMKQHCEKLIEESLERIRFRRKVKLIKRQQRQVGKEAELMMR